METFEEIWLRFLPITDGAPVKEVAELFWRKGFCDGKESVLSEIRPLVARNPLLTPAEATKLESVTIGERFDHEHFGRVIDAQKRIT